MNEVACCKRDPVHFELLLLRFGFSPISDWGSLRTEGLSFFARGYHWLVAPSDHILSGWVPGPLTPLISDQLVLLTVVTSETQE